ncbi:phage protein NinX family protein [Morganella psychrotolerans]|uniref:DUF2591 domain-containing protein n=1 Tax=Morganella psychrotolerans TaxID=368603 RepID=A0A1B8HR48_9GAMM|nr:phage protein NinX family protein [Morganella psychrotolerans]OBU11741.1 hypothetical protein AYY17_03295 [Morganella psychrotolerans]
MNKYRDKSDFEVNKAVAVSLSAEFQFDDICEKLYTDIFRNTEINYCNNPADAMPIVIENKICLTVGDSDDIWVADTTRSSESSFNENPYRAAMEVFLMMKDAENEKS